MICQELFDKIVEIVETIRELTKEYVNTAKDIASSGKYSNYKYVALGFNITDNKRVTLHNWNISLQGYKEIRQTGNMLPLVNSFMPLGEVRTHFDWEEKLNKVLDSALCGYLNEHKDEVLEYMENKLIDYLNNETALSMREINRNKEMLQDLKNSI